MPTMTDSQLEQKVRVLVDLFVASEAPVPSSLDHLDVRVWRGFDHDSDLDGYADELIWTDALEQRQYDEISREATYYWALRRDRLIITYTEGDVTIIAAANTDAAKQAFAIVDPVAASAA